MKSLSLSLSERILRVLLSAECSGAGLKQGHVTLPFGAMVYLQRGWKAMAGNTAIVMLHGACGDKFAWVRLTKALAGDLPVILPDLPGHGESAADMSRDYGIAAQAARVEMFLRALGVARVHLVANSMGGAIALRLAANHPGLVASLILIDSAGVETTASWLRRQPESANGNPLVAIATKADYRAMTRIAFEKPPFLPGFAVAALARGFARRKTINSKILADIGQDLDQKAVLAGLTLPTLILWGAEDRILSVEDGHFLHRSMANSRLIVLPGLGHVPMVEAPRQVAALCQEFYASDPLATLESACTASCSGAKSSVTQSETIEECAGPGARAS